MIFFFARRYIAHLEAEVQHLRDRCDYLQQRGDDALAALANTRAGALVAPSPRPAVPPVTRDVLAEVRAQMEADGLVNAGMVG